MASRPAREWLHTLFPYGSEKNRPDIYTTKELSTKTLGVETVAAAFTDHLAVILRLSVEVPIIRRGKGLWKMNTGMFDEETVKEKLQQQLALWRQQRRLYPDWPMWWGRYAKKTFVVSAFRKDPNADRTP